jgi:hypothetical protein
MRIGLRAWERNWKRRGFEDEEEEDDEEEGRGSKRQKRGRPSFL